MIPVIFLLFVSSAVAASKPSGASTLSGDLQNLPPNTIVDVVIQFSHPPAAADVSAITANGAKVNAIFKNIPDIVATLHAGALAGIAHNPNISYISRNRQVAGALEFAEPTVGADIALQYGWDGSGVGVAVVDSGIWGGHPDLKSRLVYSQNFVPNSTQLADLYGHGTHVAGIVAGNGSASSGPAAIYTFRGIAPKAQLVNLRVLDRNGSGTDSSVIGAIDTAISLQATYNIRVINLSLGRPIQESYALDPLCQAVERAWQAGIVVVVAAGNNGRDNSMGTSGYSTITSPGNDPYVITVGAMRDMSTIARGDDLMASYSSKGPTLLDQIVKPDLVAPGNSIRSAMAQNSNLSRLYPGNIVPVSYYSGDTSLSSSSYFCLSGTSTAAPMVSGAAALLLEKEPGLTPDQVKARLMKTATKNFPATSLATDPATGVTYETTYDLFTVGAGYLDVWGALNSSDVASGPTLSPYATFDSSTGTTSVILPPGSAWQDATNWGTAVVWGTNVIVNGTAVVWGTAVIWGTSTSQAMAVVWGTTVVWGTGQPFSQGVAVVGDN
jgi:serine protease AprX